MLLFVKFSSEFSPPFPLLASRLSSLSPQLLSSSPLFSCWTNQTRQQAGAAVRLILGWVFSIPFPLDCCLFIIDKSIPGQGVVVESIKLESAQLSYPSWHSDAPCNVKMFHHKEHTKRNQTTHKCGCRDSVKGFRVLDNFQHFDLEEVGELKVP